MKIKKGAFLPHGALSYGQFTKLNPKQLDGKFFLFSEYFVKVVERIIIIDGKALQNNHYPLISIHGKIYPFH